MHLNNTTSVCKKYHGTLNIKATCECKVFAPQDLSKKLPLFIYMGPAGAQYSRGEDIDCSPYRIAPLEIREQMIFVGMAGKDHVYDHNSMLLMLIKLCKDYPIDRNRIYLAGYSFGARYTWNMALEHPNKFAALVVLAGYSNYIAAGRIRHVPAWIFHSTDDDVVPYDEGYKMWSSLSREKARMTRFEKAGHGCNFHGIFSNPMLYKWLLEQNKQNNKAIESLLV